MEENNIEKLINASEIADSVLLLARLAESAIENDAIEKVWDLHVLFGAIKRLCNEVLSDLGEIQEDL